MATKAPAKFTWRTLDDLRIEDEASFRHVAIYGDLRDILKREKYSFRLLPEDANASSWDRALFLNLTFWGANEGGDILVESSVPADVVAHAAWHRLAAKATAAKGTNEGAKPHVEALFLGESIASAFDLYLVGRLLGHAPRSSFLATQVPAMGDAAASAGMDDDAFDAMIQEVAKDPEAAFASLRELLFDASKALFDCDAAESALATLTELESHRFGSLIHHYEIANWVLYARAYGDPAPSDPARTIDQALRTTNDPLQYLIDAWVTPLLTP